MSCLVKLVDRNPREELEYLDEYCDVRKYRKIERMVTQYLPDVKITEIAKVNNTFIKALYLIKKAEYMSRNDYVKEIRLFHATAESDVDSIALNNFDWRRVYRARYGRGTSFSTDADYANCHCNRNNGVNRALIITKVLVSNEEIGTCNLKIPSEDCDTTTDFNDLVYVKYQDNEFLPKYVVYYDCPDISESKYYRNY